jgi:1-acyl-sn-glycerol-3-phosphate acyltransferase
MYPLLRGIMHLLAATILGHRLHVSGLENVPRSGGVLVVGNHLSAADPPLTGALIPRLDVHYMAKSEHFRRRRTRWLFRGFNAYPVVRGSADRTALRHTLDLLREGHVVLVYPEGSRSPDGRLHEAQPGVGFLARHGGVPVIPAAIWGTEKVLPRGTTRIHRGDVHVRYGSPVVLPVRERGARPDNRVVAAAIMDAIAAMLPPAYRPAAAGSEDQQAPPAA